jgi:hypothetical protein
MGAPMQYGPGEPEELLATIGDISVTQNWIYTPGGAYPLRGSTWTVVDMSHETEKIAKAGWILALVFVWFCLVGLLFLLMKERTATGYYQVTVQGDGFHYSTLVPADSVHFAAVQDEVDYAQSLAAPA